MANKPLILVVEDGETVSSFIAAILEANHYDVLTTAKGSEAFTLIASHRPDLVLLDLGLPDLDGLVVLKRTRAWSNVPIIIVSARGHEREKVEALDLGADDYITKPFGTAELLARIRNAIRHHQLSNTDGAATAIQVGGLEISYEKRMVFLDGNEVHLTPIEYKIIVLLSHHLGKVLTHDFIMKEVWGPYTNEIQSLRVNMANIRRKLEQNPAEPKYIVTEVGVGYRMVEEVL